MSKTTGILSFLKDYIGKRITTIVTMSNLYSIHLVSDEVTINFEDNSQLVASCNNVISDMFFQTDEDVLFAIREDRNHTPHCNMCDMNLAPFLIDENIEGITIYYDEVSYVDMSKSTKTTEYPLGIFIRTKTRNIEICRDAISATCLYADFENGTPSLIFPIDEMWSGIDNNEPFQVKRMRWNAEDNSQCITEEKIYQ